MKERQYQVTVTVKGATENIYGLMYVVKATDKEHAKTVAMEKYEKTKAKNREMFKNATAEIKPEDVKLW